MIQVRLRLFGAFRKYSEEAEISLSVPTGSGLSELRQSLEKELLRRFPDFSERQLIRESAFADETAILGADARIGTECRLAILPPVCGG